MLGRNPCVQVAPPLMDVAKPMLDDPPPDTRPTWKAETMVLPEEKVSGSTSVRCWACASVNGSVLTCVTATFAAAGPAARNMPATTAGVNNVAVMSLRALRGMKIHLSRGVRLCGRGMPPHPSTRGQAGKSTTWLSPFTGNGSSFLGTMGTGALLSGAGVHRPRGSLPEAPHRH